VRNAPSFQRKLEPRLQVAQCTFAALRAVGYVPDSGLRRNDDDGGGALLMSYAAVAKVVFLSI
jgi:hypothetical protein